MYRIKNGRVTADVDENNGLICGLYWGSEGYNLADKNGMGGITYTLIGDDVRTERPFCPYEDRLAAYDEVQAAGNRVSCKNIGLNIQTVYRLKEDGLVIESHTQNGEISQFGVDCNLNFLSKKNGTYRGQPLPSSPYTSYYGDKMYCIMPMIEYGFCVVSATGPCKAWRIDYSGYSFGHFIKDFKILSALDGLYGGGGAYDITVELTFAATIDECYQKIQRIFGCPMLLPEISGSFGEFIDLKCLGSCDGARVIYGERERDIPVSGDLVRVNFEEYGRYHVIPYKDGQAGLDTVVWFGEDIDRLFEKSCDTLIESYVGDKNLCESMVWCWAKLMFMNFYGSKKYLQQVKDALEVVMGNRGEPIWHHTIVPYSVNGFPAYHIYDSKRIQEQFFGISMLTEMYRLTQEDRYLDFAVKAAETMLKSYQREDGALVPHNDYTTVCAPIIALVDLAVILRGRDAERSEYFAAASRKIVDYLVRRGFHFPTEGIVSRENDEEMEEGSISCTALSVLYYCRYIECTEEYVAFAEQVLDFHMWWRCYTPDARMYMSTMRWWETIWEGDGDGPCICAGHAWGIWRAEADFHMAVLTRNPDYFIKSWNGYINNFAKITPEGESFACYQPDYFTGGGDPEIRRDYNPRLGEEKKYRIVHDYPHTFDPSLSRYVWVRACRTWLKTAVLVAKEKEPLALNCRVENNRITFSDYIEDVFVFGDIGDYDLCGGNYTIRSIC